MEIETNQEKTTRIEIEERINKDLEQAKDTLTTMNFVTTVTE